MTGRLRIGICGLGLIGSSLARALAADADLLVLDPAQEATRTAAQLGMHQVADLAGLARCDLLALAAPTGENTRLLAAVIERGPRVPTMDLGSVKVPIQEVWVEYPAFPFVGTHPMAGSERSGAAAGSADLFRGSTWPVVVTPRTDPAALLLVLRLILRLGARPVPMSAERHDDAVALASHLPHLLSGALGGTVAVSPVQRGALLLAAGSFRDVSRVSASPPRRTAEFLTANRLRVAAATRLAAQQLDRAADLLASGDEEAVAAWLAHSHRVRETFEALQAHGGESDAAVGSAAQLRDLLVRQRDSGRMVTEIVDEGGALRVRFVEWST